MPKVPVTPAVLSWALKDSACGLRDVAEATGRSPALVADWVDGRDQPKLGDLTIIAELCGRSREFFLLPEPPTDKTYVASFRSRPGVLKTSLDRGEILAIRSAESIQENVRWLRDKSTRVSIPRIVSNPENYARIITTWLDWDTHLQVSASSKVGLFRTLRRSVEDRGIIVLLRDLGEKTCRGFSLPDRSAPLIFINKGYQLGSVRSYTLLHELAHLGFDEQFLCFTPDSSRERWCDSFAAALLMPREHLTTYVTRQLKKDQVGSTDLDTVRLISNRYKTSWQAAARRLKDLGLASQSLVSRVDQPNTEVEQKGFVAGGTKRPSLRLDEFGYTYTRTILQAAKDRRIPDLEARRKLNLNGDELKEAEHLVAGL